MRIFLIWQQAIRKHEANKRILEHEMVATDPERGRPKPQARAQSYGLNYASNSYAQEI